MSIGLHAYELEKIRIIIFIANGNFDIIGIYISEVEGKVDILTSISLLK